MSAENIWVTPTAAKVSAVMAQLITNAAIKVGGVDNTPALLAYHVTAVREAVRQGAKTALSQDTTTVPPDAEFHCYVLTANALTASTPNLGTVVVTMNGGVMSPWNDLVKDARSYINKLRMPVKDGGIYVANPSWPFVTGGGDGFVQCGSVYDVNSTIAVTGLQIGKQYYWTPGPNEVSLVCGSTTLTTTPASFFAIATTATITGNGVGNQFTGQLQRAVSPVTAGRSDRIIGEYDLSTPAYGNFVTNDPNLGTL
jgi:hypothetical protein